MTWSWTLLIPLAFFMFLVLIGVAGAMSRENNDAGRVLSGLLAALSLGVIAVFVASLLGWGG